MKLKDWLDREKISPAVFAERIGTGPVAVYRYVNGVRTPKPAIMLAIKRETGGAVTPADFYPASDATSGGPVGNGAAA